MVVITAPCDGDDVIIIFISQLSRHEHNFKISQMKFFRVPQDNDNDDEDGDDDANGDGNDGMDT